MMVVRKCFIITVRIMDGFEPKPFHCSLRLITFRLNFQRLVRGTLLRSGYDPLILSLKGKCLTIRPTEHLIFFLF